MAEPKFARNYILICKFFSLATTSYDNGIIQAFWPFDNTTMDFFGIYNSIGINNITYSSSSITGYGSALLLSVNHSRYVNITTPMLLANSSFTFELWIYINSYSTLEWLGIIGKCFTQEFSINVFTSQFDSTNLIWVFLIMIATVPHH